MKATEALAIKQIKELEEQLKVANIRLTGFSALIDHIDQSRKEYSDAAKRYALDAVCGDPDKKAENEESTKETNAKAILCDELLAFVRSH